MKNVKKALIPVAGLGTRFLPATKSVPKEMLPIVDKPIIYYIAQEAVAAGIQQLVLVTAPEGKKAIVDFFNATPERLDQNLKDNGKESLIADLEDLRSKIEIITTVQDKPLGLGHAVYCGHSVVGNEPFAVMLGDELSYSKPGEVNDLRHLVTHYESTGCSTVSVMEVPKEDVYKYGIVASANPEANPLKVDFVVEKPSVAEAPTHLALPGRYVFDSAIFEYLKHTAPGKNGEIQLTDGMTQLAQNQGLYAMRTKGLRYDAGDKLGFVIANIEYALREPELKAALTNYLQQGSWKS